MAYEKEKSKEFHFESAHPWLSLPLDGQGLKNILFLTTQGVANCTEYYTIVQGIIAAFKTAIPQSYLDYFLHIYCTYKLHL